MSVKYISLLLVTIVTLFACNSEDIVNSPYQDLRINTDFLKLSDNNSAEAGNLIINANVSEVTIKWNTGTLCNLDTTQTTLKLSKGSATLPIKWLGKLKTGMYGPEGVAFKAGVQITAGDKSQYVPLVWAEKIDSTEILKSVLQTRVPGDIMPRVAQISMIPITVNMNDVNGGSMYVGLTDVAFAVFDWSEFFAEMNVDMNALPNSIQASTMLNFKWKNGGAPAFGFFAGVIAMSEGLVQTGIVRFEKTTTPPQQITLSSNLTNLSLTSNKQATSRALIRTNDSKGWTASVAEGNWFGITTSGIDNSNLNVTTNSDNITGYTRTGKVIVRSVTSPNTQLTITVSQSSYANDDYYLVNGVRWAKANLVYQGANNIVFATSQYDIGSYFGWNTLTSTVNSHNSGYYNYNNDPCSKVVPAGRWITPTVVQFQSLINVGYQIQTAPYKGCWMGGSVFLRAGGYRKDSGEMFQSGVSCQYWTREATATADAPQGGRVLVAFEDRNYPSVSASQDWHWRGYGLNVRCVRQ